MIELEPNKNDLDIKELNKSIKELIKIQTDAYKRLDKELKELDEIKTVIKERNPLFNRKITKNKKKGD